MSAIGDALSVTGTCKMNVLIEVIFTVPAWAIGETTVDAYHDTPARLRWVARHGRSRLERCCFQLFVICSVILKRGDLSCLAAGSAIAGHGIRM